ncbi:hypothetical protein D3C75_1267650 [compost metagenome]
MHTYDGHQEDQQQGQAGLQPAEVIEQRQAVAAADIDHRQRAVDACRQQTGP